jgi:ferredoxin
MRLSTRVHAVSIEGQVVALAPDNANLREVLRRAGLRVNRGLRGRLHCDGQGRCRTCRVTVLRGSEHLSPPTPQEVARRADEAPPVRLACQAAVRGPIDLAR